MSAEQLDLRITWESVSLTAGGIVWVAYPAGSYDIHADDRTDLAQLLAEAMEAHGLGSRAEEVFLTLRALARPHFEKTVAEFEQLRQEAVAEDS